MRNNRGAVLLEVLAAVVIFATVGIAVTQAVVEGMAGELSSRQREHTLAAEERLIGALTLLRRNELDERIGKRQVGEFVIDVQRPEPTLYRIAIKQVPTRETEDLVTVVYRPPPQPQR